MKMRISPVRLCSVLVALALLCSPAHAKGGDEQAQIILLNDSASALEDSNPGLSHELAGFADQKEKAWEASRKDKSSPPLVPKKNALWIARVKLLKDAAHEMEPTYPVIAKNLMKMAANLQDQIEAAKSR